MLQAMCMWAQHNADSTWAWRRAVFIPDVKVTQFIGKSAKHSYLEKGLLSSRSKLHVVFTPEKEPLNISRIIQLWCKNTHENL